MALSSTNTVTLHDVRQRMDPNGMLAKVVEVLNLENYILEDIPWLEGNLPTGNETTIRTSIPTINTRSFNAGAANVKTTTRQVTDTCCILETNSEIDRDLLRIQNNPEGFRMSEDLGIAEAFRQAVANYIFYGDSYSSPEQFNGFAVRYSTMVGAQKGNIQYQTISAGGSLAVNTSAWLVNWGETSVCGIFPQNTQAGLRVQDMGCIPITDASGNRLWVYSTNIQWMPGLAVKNFRGVARVCNIDTTNLQTFGTASDTSPNLVKFMILAQNRIPLQFQAGLCWYVNELVYSYLECMLASKNPGGGQVYITRQELMNKPPQLFVNGVPVKKCDALLSNESTVT